MVFKIEAVTEGAPSHRFENGALFLEETSAVKVVRHFEERGGNRERRKENPLSLKIRTAAGKRTQYGFDVTHQVTSGDLIPGITGSEEFRMLERVVEYLSFAVAVTVHVRPGVSEKTQIFELFSVRLRDTVNRLGFAGKIEVRILAEYDLFERSLGKVEKNGSNVLFLSKIRIHVFSGLNKGSRFRGYCTGEEEGGNFLEHVNYIFFKTIMTLFPNHLFLNGRGIQKKGTMKSP